LRRFHGDSNIRPLFERPCRAQWRAFTRRHIDADELSRHRALGVDIRARSAISLRVVRAPHPIAGADTIEADGAVAEAQFHLAAQMTAHFEYVSALFRLF